jgi:transposase
MPATYRAHHGFQECASPVRIPLSRPASATAIYITRMSTLVRTAAGARRAHIIPPYSPELNPQENLWDEIREKYSRTMLSIPWTTSTLNSMEAAFYIERNPTLVESITSFRYIAKSL